MLFPDKYTTRDKHLLRLERELKRLRHAHWHAPIVPLEHPYQRGWVKSFVMREDALKHPEAAAFKEILKVINRQVFSRNREFTDRNDDPIALYARIIPIQEWHKLAWPITHQRMFFFGNWWQEDSWPRIRRHYWHHTIGFKLIRTWWIEESVQPNMITHQRVELPEVRERLAEIEAFMIARAGWRRLDRLHGHKNHWRRFEWSAPERRAETAHRDQFECLLAP